MQTGALVRALTRLLTATVVLYLGGLLLWAGCRWYWGDRWWWLFMLNVFAPYLFLPSAFFVVAALALRSRPLAASAATIALLGFVALAPSFPLGLPRAAPDGPALTVLSYNVFGHSDCAACVIATIRAADADLVALQELTPTVAGAIERELAVEYPFRVLAAEPGVLGMGAISRYPLRETGETLPGRWFAPPQALALDFAGQSIAILHVHPSATPLTGGARMEASIRSREEQARAVADFAAAHSGPLVAPGDYNTTDRNVAYATLSGALRDSWREAGRGPGHSFPGGADYPLNWLVRIDYVFHSHHWRATEARVLPWDGASDHRPLLVRLALR